MWHVVGHCHGEELGSFCWPMLAALQFLVHSINLLSILLRCNGFTRIQKAVVDQTGSRLPNSDHDFLLVQIWLWEVLWSFFLALPLSWLLHKVHFSLHITIWLRNGSLLHRIREDDMRLPLIEFFFNLSNLLQMSNNHGIVDVEFFGNF